MTTLLIDASEHGTGPGWQAWVRDEVRAREAAGAYVCVRVKVETPDVDLVFPCGACGSGSGKRPRLSPAAQRLVDLWRSLGLDEWDLEMGALVRFVKATDGAA